MEVFLAWAEGYEVGYLHANSNNPYQDSDERSEFWETGYVSGWLDREGDTDEECEDRIQD